MNRIEPAMNLEELRLIDDEICCVPVPGEASYETGGSSQPCGWCHENNSAGNLVCYYCGLSLKDGPETQIKMVHREAAGVMVTPKRVSSLGVASTVVSILLGLLFVVSIIIVLFLPEDTDPLWYVLLALGWVALFFGGAGGVGLSVGAFMQRGRSRLFPAVGLLFNLMLLAGVLFTLLIGLVFALPMDMENGDEIDAYKFVWLEQTQLNEENTIA